MLEAVVGETNVWSVSRYDHLNVAALRRLVANGAQLRPYSRDILLACHRATQETHVELGDRNPRFKRVHAHWDRFRQDSQSWFRVAEASSANFLSIAERS